MSFAATGSFQLTFFVSPRQMDTSMPDWAFDSRSLMMDSSERDCIVSTIEDCALCIALSIVDRALTGEINIQDIVSLNILCFLSLSKRRSR